MTDERQESAKPPPTLAGLVRSGAGGIYALPGSVGVDAVAVEAAAAGRRLIRLGASGVAGKNAFLDRAAAALMLPAHFGRNWDALYDCVTDELPAALGGAVLLVDGVEALAANDPEALATAIEVFRAAAEHWSARGRPLLILVQPAEAATGVEAAAVAR